MKKVKILVTTLMVSILCLGATFAVLGYDHIENFFCDLLIKGGKQYFSGEEIRPTESKNCAMSLYYDYIQFTGAYEVGLYQEDEYVEGVYYYYKTSNRRSVRATSTPGFSSTRVYAEKKRDYVVYIMCGYTNILVDKLRVSYD